MAWKDIEQDTRYLTASPEDKLKVKITYYQNVIKKDARYTPEQDEELRTAFFGQQQTVEPTGEVAEQKPLSISPLLAGPTGISSSGITEKQPIEESLGNVPSLQATAFGQTQLDRPSAGLRTLSTGQGFSKGFLYPQEAPQWVDVLKPKLGAIKNETAKDITARLGGLIIDSLVYSAMGGTAAKLPKAYTGVQGAATRKLTSYISEQLVKRGVESKEATQVAKNMVWNKWQSWKWMNKFPTAIDQSINFFKKNPKIIDTTVDWMKFNKPGEVVPKEPLALPSKTFIAGQEGIQPPLTFKQPKGYKALPDPNSYYKDVVEQLGGEYKGIQYGKGNKRALIMFNDKSGTTLAVPEKNFSWKTVKDKMYGKPSTRATINYNDPTTQRDVLNSITPLQAKGNPFDLNMTENIQDVSYTMQNLQRRTGIPFFDRFYNNLITLHNKVQTRVADIMNKITRGVSKGSLTEKSDLNILNAILKENSASLTTAEKEIATAVETAFRKTRPVVKYLKLRRMIDGVIETPKGLTDSVQRGKIILRDKGSLALFKYARKLKFGTIDEGYFPATLKRALIERQGLENPFTLNDPHVQSRVSPVQNYASEVSLVSRVQTYFKRVYSDFFMYDEFKDFSEVLKGQQIPSKTLKAFTDWARALKGFGNPVGLFGDIMRKMRGQFMITVFTDVTKWVRNLMQNAVFLTGHYKAKVLLSKLKGGYKLTPKDTKFIREQLSQKADLAREHMALYEVEKSEKFALNRLATEISEKYAATDEINRVMAYRIVMKDLESDLVKYSNGQMTFEQLANKQGLYNLTPLERRYALNLPPEESSRYIAKLISDKVNGRYKLADKGFAALTELGESAMFLYTYPKMVQTVLANCIRMVVKGKSFSEKYAGVQEFISVYIMGQLADSVLRNVFGSIDYLDPTTKRLKESKSYDLIDTMLGITMFGAQKRQFDIIHDFIDYTSELINPETWQDPKKIFSTTRGMARAADLLTEQFVPFLKQTMNVVEALTDDKQYRLISTTMDKVWAKRSRIAAGKAHRNIIEALSHAAFGTERKGEE